MNPTDQSTLDQHDDAVIDARDQGGILVFVLVVVTIASLIVIPMLTYSSAVIRAGAVQSDRSQAIEYANGGAWVAMANEADLFDICTGGNLPSSLPGVVTTCDVLETSTLRPASELPFDIATIHADATVPAGFATGNSYVNPNTSADALAWLTTPDWSSDPQAGKVWIPQLPVQATSTGGNRDTTMLPGTQDPNYASCRVLFPGTFNTEMVFDGPTYLTSGVYYFTQPIVLRDGADVVLGNGSEIGCTTDFEAISSATAVPDPLNMNGLGGTIVLGEQGRITIDDDGSGDIRFAVNQRFVSDEEEGVAASADVAIISVNGQHQPFLGTEAAGDPLIVPGAIAVPASTVGTDGDPAAVNSGYLPSEWTVKPGVPDAPVVTSVVDYQVVAGNDGVDDGLLVVSWTKPNNNGALITSYVATDQSTGLSCSPTVPTPPLTSVQTSCTIQNVPHQTTANPPDVVVTAVNSYGSSLPSDSFPITAGEPRADLNGSTQSPLIAAPGEPQNAQVGVAYNDGLQVTWDEPADLNRAPVSGYFVSATDTVSGAVHNCVGQWDDRSCVLPLPTPDPLLPPIYDIVMVAYNDEAIDAATDQSGAVPVATAYVYAPGTDPRPPFVPETADTPIATPILNFETTTSTSLDITIKGYVSVPQGRVLVNVADPATSTVRFTGGMAAGQLDFVAAPTTTTLEFENPVAQKRVRIRSVYDGDGKATAEAVVQVNRSGSLAINSWAVQ